MPAATDLKGRCVQDDRRVAAGRLLALSAFNKSRESVVCGEAADLPVLGGSRQAVAEEKITPASKTIINRESDQPFAAVEIREETALFGLVFRVSFAVGADKNVSGHDGV